MDRDAGIKVSTLPARATQAHRLNAMAGRMAVGMVAALVLVLAFSRLVNLQSVFQRLQRLSVGPALLCGLVFLSAYVVRALRWRCFLGPKRVSVTRVVATYQVAIFVNWLLPVRGGELVKCLLLRRLNAIPVSESLPTVAMDKTMDLLPAVVLVVLVPFMPFQLSRPLWVLLVTVLVVLTAGTLFLGLAVWRRQTARAALTWLTGKLPKPLRERVEPFAVHFLDALVALVMQPRLLGVAALYTALAVFLDALFFLLAFRAVGADIAFPIVLYGYSLFNLAYMLPTPPGQIGSNEVIGLLIFSGLFSVNPTVVAANFLFSHPWTALLMTATGLLSLSAMGLSLRSTLTFAQQPVAANARQ